MPQELYIYLGELLEIIDELSLKQYENDTSKKKKIQKFHNKIIQEQLHIRMIKKQLHKYIYIYIYISEERLETSEDIRSTIIV